MKYLACWCCLLLLAVGCGSNNVLDEPVVVTETVITTAGGIVTEGDAEVTFPPGSVTRDIIVSSSSGTGAPVELPGAVGRVYRFVLSDPGAYNPATPATIRLPLAGAANPLIYRLPEGGGYWISINGGVGGGSISATVPAFSRFYVRKDEDGRTIVSSVDPEEFVIDINRIGFLDNSDKGLAVGTRGTILATTDGGRSWHAQNSTVIENLWSLVIDQINHDRAWVVGDSGTLLYTTNGGEEWQSYASGEAGRLNDIDFFDGKGCIVGDDGVILYSGDGGNSWVKRVSNTIENLNAVSFDGDSTDGDNIALVTGDNGTLLKTFDGGSQWFSLDPNFTGLSSDLNDIVFPSPDNPVIASNHGLFFSSNRGHTWATKDQPVISHDYFSAVAGTGNRIVALGSGFGYYSNDAGATWQEYNDFAGLVPPESQMTAVHVSRQTVAPPSESIQDSLGFKSDGLFQFGIRVNY